MRKKSERNDQAEPGENVSQKRLKEKRGKAKKGRKMASKELTFNAGTTVVKPNFQRQRTEIGGNAIKTVI